MYVDIKIAVTPVVKAFLRTKICIEPYFELSQDNKYGIFLYNCLARRKNPRTAPAKPARKKNAIEPVISPLKKKKRSNEVDTSIYSEILVVRISEDTYRRCGHCVAPLKQIGFNRLVQFDINEYFYLWVECCVDINGMTLYKSFFSFREKFQLSEDELTLKNMEKKYERHRQRVSA